MPRAPSALSKPTGACCGDRESASRQRGPIWIKAEADKPSAAYGRERESTGRADASRRASSWAIALVSPKVPAMGSGLSDRRRSDGRLGVGAGVEAIVRSTAATRTRATLRRAGRAAPSRLMRSRLRRGGRDGPPTAPPPAAGLTRVRRRRRRDITRSAAPALRKPHNMRALHRGLELAELRNLASPPADLGRVSATTTLYRWPLKKRIRQLLCGWGASDIRVARVLCCVRKRRAEILKTIPGIAEQAAHARALQDCGAA
jgi:hypothetical protein